MTLHEIFLRIASIYVGCIFVIACALNLTPSLEALVQDCGRLEASLATHLVMMMYLRVGLR